MTYENQESGSHFLESDPEMNQMLRLTDENFKVTIIRINTLKNLEEKRDQVGEWMVNFTREMETLKKNHMESLELKKHIFQIQRMY